MRLLRGLMIVLLAAGTGTDAFHSYAVHLLVDLFVRSYFATFLSGYYIATTTAGSYIPPMTMLSSDASDASAAAAAGDSNDLLGQFLTGAGSRVGAGSAAASASAQDTAVFDEAAASNRSWSEWFWEKVTLQLQCSLSAVMVARWLTNALFGKIVDVKVRNYGRVNINMLMCVYAVSGQGTRWRQLLDDHHEFLLQRA